MIIDYIKRLKLIYDACEFKRIWILYLTIILAILLSIFEAFFIGLIYSVISSFFETDSKLPLLPFNSFFNDKDIYENYLILLSIGVLFIVAILKVLNLKLIAYLYSYTNTIVSSHIFNKTYTLV